MIENVRQREEVEIVDVLEVVCTVEQVGLAEEALGDEQCAHLHHHQPDGHGQEQPQQMCHVSLVHT